MRQYLRGCKKTRISITETSKWGAPRNWKGIDLEMISFFSDLWRGKKYNRPPQYHYEPLKNKWCDKSIIFRHIRKDRLYHITDHWNKAPHGFQRHVRTFNKSAFEKPLAFFLWIVWRAHQQGNVIFENRDQPSFPIWTLSRGTPRSFRPLKSLPTWKLAPILGGLCNLQQRKHRT